MGCLLTATGKLTFRAPSLSSRGRTGPAVGYLSLVTLTHATRGAANGFVWWLRFQPR
jgi:hypothetical protein